MRICIFRNCVIIIKRFFVCIFAPYCEKRIYSIITQNLRVLLPQILGGLTQRVNKDFEVRFGNPNASYIYHNPPPFCAGEPANFDFPLSTTKSLWNSKWCKLVLVNFHVNVRGFCKYLASLLYNIYEFSSRRTSAHRLW